MINIKFLRSSKGLLAFEVKGHAGYDEEGQDIVCSAVSSLAQTTILGVTEILKINAPYVAEEANISIDLTELSENNISKCSVLMETLLLGLKNIECSYGDYISVQVEEVE